MGGDFDECEEYVNTRRSMEYQNQDADAMRRRSLALDPAMRASKVEKGKRGKVNLMKKLLKK